MGRFQQLKILEHWLMLTLEVARRVAEALLDEVRAQVDFEIAIDLPQTVHTGNEWIFFYNSKTFLETGNPTYALAGNGPVIVSDQDGRVRLATTSKAWEKQV